MLQQYRRLVGLSVTNVPHWTHSTMMFVFFIRTCFLFYFFSIASLATMQPQFTVRISWRWKENESYFIERRETWGGKKEKERGRERERKKEAVQACWPSSQAEIVRFKLNFIHIKCFSSPHALRKFGQLSRKLHIWMRRRYVQDLYTSIFKLPVNLHKNKHNHHKWEDECVFKKMKIKIFRIWAMVHRVNIACWCNNNNNNRNDDH